MFDVTLTEKEFLEAFVNKDADWLVATRSVEPDLEVDGLRGSIVSRLLALVTRSEPKKA